MLKKYFNEQSCIKKHFSWVFYNFDDICGVFKTITHFMTIWPTVPPPHFRQKKKFLCNFIQN